MINRIRDIRHQQGLTLSDVAAACDPPTTAQTIGRLETGMRNLSLAWMNRIATALDVAPEALLHSENAPAPTVIAVLGPNGAEPLRSPRAAVSPQNLSGERPWLVLSVEAALGEFRSGDQLWLQQRDAAEAGDFINRDLLLPLPAGHFVFGRLVSVRGNQITLLPTASGKPLETISAPAWLATAEMLVRKL